MKLSTIQTAVEWEYGLKPDEFKSKRRYRKIMDARKAFIYFANEKGFPLDEIKSFLNYDRSTIAHHLNSAKALIATDKAFYFKAQKIKKLINEADDDAPFDAINPVIIKHIILLLKDTQKKLENLLN